MEVTFEVIAAAALLRQYAPQLRVRVVNVTDLMILGVHGSHPHSLTDDAFDALFTHDKPIIINYHGYPMELKGLLFGRPKLDRVTIHGYLEEGTTTSPFDASLHVVLLFALLTLNSADDALQSNFAVRYRSRRCPWGRFG